MTQAEAGKVLVCRAALGMACEAVRDTGPSRPHHLAGLQLQLTAPANWPARASGHSEPPVPSLTASAKSTLPSGCQTHRQ